MKSKNVIKLVIIAILIILLLGITFLGIQNNWWQESQGTSTVTPTPQISIVPTTTFTTMVSETISPTSSQYPVKVYFSKHNDSDNDPSKVFPVDRIAPDISVAKYSIQQLILGPTNSESTQGYYSEIQGTLSGVSNCNSEDFSISLNTKGNKPEQGTATLKFCKTTSLPGDLSGGRIKAEIEKTLLQFNTITKVVILNKDGNCFDDFSELNLCLK